MPTPPPMRFAPKAKPTADSVRDGADADGNSAN